MVKVAILPKDQEMNSNPEELLTLEDAIVEEMMLGAKYKLRFSGTHFCLGMLVGTTHPIVKDTR